MIPNIFKYATTELSQDALICWLVDCAKDETACRLRECGRKFVQALIKCEGCTVIDNSIKSQAPPLDKGNYDTGEIEILCGPKKQHNHIDVCFRARVGSNQFCIVIESKKDSEMHNDQLKRYRKEVQPGEIGVYVYFKTGYVYQDEKEKAKEEKYAVFNSRDMLEFLKDAQCYDAHEILRQFEDHLRCQVEERKRALENRQLEFDFVQWDFMIHLRNALQIEGKKMWPGKGKNSDGSAWTQYPHWDDGRRVLFWRLDWRLNSQIPLLRLMLDTRNVDDQNQLTQRWVSWSNKFKDECKESGLSAGKFRRIISRKGKIVRQGTIGAVDIAKCLRDEGPEECTDKIRCLHWKFMKSVGKEIEG